MKYWLVKSEPDVYSIDHMAKDGTTLWENVRNYQARNYMTKDMKVGDRALFYHSNSTPPAVVGLVEISDSAQADPTQFDERSEYFEPRATAQEPVWFCVEVRFREKLTRPVSLDEIKKQKSLAKMILLNNSRLSVQPVTAAEFKTILKLAGKKS